MKHIGKELKNIIESRQLMKKAIAEQLDFTPTNLSAIFKKASIDCDLLDRICRVIQVPPSYFFDEPGSVNNVNATTVIGNAQAAVGASATELATLRELLAEKERTIQILLAQVGAKTGHEN